MNNSSHRSKARLDSCNKATSVSNQMSITNHELGYRQTESICSYIVSFLTSIRDSQLIRAPCPIAISANGLTVSQERGFGSNHLVFLKARPQHAMGRCELRILGSTRYNTRNIYMYVSIDNWSEVAYSTLPTRRCVLLCRSLVQSQTTESSSFSHLSHLLAPLLRFLAPQTSFQ